MKRWLSYVGVSAVVLTACTAALWGLLETEGRTGIVWAAGVAWVVQSVAFGMVLGLRDRKQGLLLAMAGGTAARLGSLGAAGVVVTVGETGIGAAALLLGLAGFLFALALLEAVFLQGAETGRSG